MYTLNDFFCGCGGLGLGFQNAGFKIVGAWDFDKFAVATYRENVGDHVVQADIQQMRIEDVPKADVWAFGFPCQDLSVAGKQAGIKLECSDCGEIWEVDYENYDGKNICPRCGGTNHKAATRSGMFFEIMRLLAEARERERETEKVPKVLVAENVKALRKVLPVLEAEYEKAGYDCHAQLFNSKYWDVPQNRERYIVVGTLVNLPDTYEYPEEQHDFIPTFSDFLDKSVPEKYFINAEKVQRILEKFVVGSGCAYSVPLKFINRNQKVLPDYSLCLDVAQTNGVLLKVAKDIQDKYLTQDGVSYCLDANYFKGTVASGFTNCRRTHVVDIVEDNEEMCVAIRRYTPTEYGRLQAFPMETWKQVVSDTQAYKQFGNAVTVTLAEAVGKSIITYLGGVAV